MTHPTRGGILPYLLQQSSLHDLLSGPSLTVQIFTRPKIGFRKLGFRKILFMTVLMFVYADLWDVLPKLVRSLQFFMPATSPAAGGFPPQPASGLLWMRLYALAFAAYALLENRDRWRMLNRGQLWHTKGYGLTRLTFLTRYFREATVLRFFDPLLPAFAALPVMLISRPLGWWLLFSAVCFFVAEQQVYEWQLNAALDDHDSLADSEAHRATMMLFQPTAATAAGSSLKDIAEAKRAAVSPVAGVIPPAAVAPDITAANAQRQQEQDERKRQERREWMESRAKARRAAQQQQEAQTQEPAA